jgi:hypothetical protein
MDDECFYCGTETNSCPDCGSCPNHCRCDDENED